VWGQEKEQDRLKECGQVMTEILNVPDEIPQDLLDKAECVVVFPSVKKFAIGIGGSYGRGALICRGGENYTGPWGVPAMYALEGGNIGFQLGGEATDFVLLIMNDKGARSVLSSKVAGRRCLGCGRTQRPTAAAATDVVMKAEILELLCPRTFCWSFAGGFDARSDGGANENLYNKDLGAKDIILGRGKSAGSSARADCGT
jgi:lipid-binding SYLF domain-containing protein